MKSFKAFITERENSEEDTPTTGIHYSGKADLTHLSGEKSGSGIRGEEQGRLSTTKDERIKKRVYFYPKSDEGLPKPETGLGIHVYEAKLHHMYDPKKVTEQSKALTAKAEEHVKAGEHPSNAFERAVLDTGYHGYHTPTMSVVLGRDVPVKYKGTSVGKSFIEHQKPTPEKYSVFHSKADKEGHHQSSMMTGEQSLYYQKHKDKLKSAVPSLGMAYGRMSVHKDDLEKLRKELEKKHHPF